jgi:phosphoglycolate phosphatase
VLGREPSRAELNKVMQRRLHHLYQTVADSDDYRVLDGVEELLPRMLEQGYLLGLVTGNVEAAAHIKRTARGSTGISPSAATVRTPPTGAS